jgi:enterochelin esterase family protein
MRKKDFLLVMQVMRRINENIIKLNYCGLLYYKRARKNQKWRTQMMRNCKVVLASIWMFCAVLLAQNTAPALVSAQNAQTLEVAPQDRAMMTVLPPYQVQPDNRVTFQFKAPQATSVEVEGEWPGGLGGRSTIPMVKDEQGIWTVTVGPLPSDIWSYSFVVNGVPVMPNFGPFGGPTSLPASNFVIPGTYGDDFAPHGAPQGVVAYPYVPFMGTTKHLTVYTPPDYYENPTKRYPVLYLTMGGLHDGSTGDQDAYMFILLENMIASGRTTPMIVVVLDPEAPGGNSIGWSSFQGGGNQTSPMYVKAAQAIADEIVPWVDNAFRTIPDRDHRAIIGFSSPGAQGFLAGARNPDKFATIGTFSGGFPTWPGVGVPIQSKLDPKQYSGPDLNRVPDMEKLGAMIPKLNASANMKLVYLSVGTNEPLIQTQQLMKKFLDERGVKYYAVERPGYTHEGRNIRVSLHDFLTRVFK